MFYGFQNLLSSSSLTLEIVNLLAAGMLMTALIIQMQRGLTTCVNLYIVQSFFLALVSFFIAIGFQEGHLMIAAALAILIKVIAIPWMFFWIIKKINIRREVQFYLNPSLSLLISGLLVALSFFIIYRTAIFEGALSKGAVAISLCLVFLGLFFMISRTKAVTQLVGFLMLENGLFLLANVATAGVPLVVEVGIFFDVLVLLIIAGVFVFKMNSTFSHIDVTKLKGLKE